MIGKNNVCYRRGPLVALWQALKNGEQNDPCYRRYNVEDVAKWVSSPLRQSVFVSKGIKVTTFTDPAGSNVTGLLFDVPDMDEFQKMMQSEEIEKSAKEDGVKLDTLQVSVKT